MFRAACLGVFAAMLAGLIVVLSGIGWDSPVPMLRERLFLASLNAIFCGWLAAVAACFLSARAVKQGGTGALAFAAVAVAVALVIAPLHLLALPAAAAVALLGLRRPFRPLPLRWSARLGLALHAAPLAIFFLMPADDSAIPLTEPWRDLPPAPASAPVARVSASQPDVLLIVADTLRADAIGNPRVPTPALAGLRARGVWADFAIAPSNQTLPSHMVLLTGLDIEKTGMRSNESRWPERTFLRDEWRAVPLAERFGSAGWRTVGIASNPVLTEVPSRATGDQTFDDGFEVWFGMGRVSYISEFMAWSLRRTLLGLCVPRQILQLRLGKALRLSMERQFRVHRDEGARTTDAALHVLGQCTQQERPYFLFINYLDPHAPYIAPAPFAGSIADLTGAPEGYPGWPYGEYAMRKDMTDALAGGGKTEDWEAERDHLHDLYREEVAYLDAQIGKVIEAVDRSGRPTLVLFTADHGEAFAEHRRLEHRWTIHEEEVRVPFALAGPGVPAAGRLDFAPELVDLPRTLLELCGLPVATTDGRSLFADPGPREALNMMWGQAALRDARYKLMASLSYGEVEDPEITGLQAGAYALQPYALFDLAADPGEVKNLLADFPEVAARLEAALRERLERDSFPSLKPRKMTEGQKGFLAQLGYADGPGAQEHP
jgi:arylsulfatase A-like enzyme